MVKKEILTSPQMPIQMRCPRKSSITMWTQFTFRQNRYISCMRSDIWCGAIFSEIYGWRSWRFSGVGFRGFWRVKGNHRGRLVQWKGFDKRLQFRRPPRWSCRIGHTIAGWNVDVSTSLHKRGPEMTRNLDNGHSALIWKLLDAQKGKALQPPVYSKMV